MSRSSEEVLLIVSHVKNKKCQGSLYMMGERMAWMTQTKSTFSVSHNYADIKAQKISPDTKDKVQLQVVMHDGSANTFHFVNPRGRPEQQKDRESVKELLQQLLPAFRNKVNSELEQKNRMLQKDPQLFQLYKDLVVSGVISAEEFWASRTSAKSAVENQQQVGVSAAFLADIKPQTDGCNGLKYNLTSDIIQAIFTTYPAVKQRHLECVPGQLSEHEFWTRFFQSHYFHRDRISFTSKDLFAECAKADDQELAAALGRPVEDRLLDLGGMTDGMLGEGYGSSADSRAAPSTASDRVNASLIKRFNQHSTRVLAACEQKSAGAKSLDAQPSGKTQNLSVCASTSVLPATNGAGSSGRPNGLASTSLPTSASSASLYSWADDNSCSSFAVEPPPPKKARLREKLEYADLRESSSSSAAPPRPHDAHTPSHSGATESALHLAHTDRYLHGPTAVTASTYASSEDLLQASESVGREILIWQPELRSSLQPSTATSVLGELTPGGAIMQHHSAQQFHRLVSAPLQTELRQLYSALGELLRHFWACFPVTSRQLEEKVIRMRENLDRFQTAKLNPFKQRLHDSHYSINLCGHFDEMLQAAFSKYSVWHNKRLGSKT